MRKTTGEHSNIPILGTENDDGGIVSLAEKSPWKAPTLKSLNAHQAEGKAFFSDSEPNDSTGSS